MARLLRQPAEMSPSHTTTATTARLTPRRHEVLRALARSLHHTEISREMGIVSEMVRTHIRDLMARAGVEPRLEAVAAGMREWLIDPPD